MGLVRVLFFFSLFVCFFFKQKNQISLVFDTRFSSPRARARGSDERARELMVTVWVDKVMTCP